MKTIDGVSACNHRWRDIGAHTLHAGQESGRIMREVRHVKVCQCGEVRVHIERHEAYAHNAEHRAALLNQHARNPGRTAVGLVRRKQRAAQRAREAQVLEAQRAVILPSKSAPFAWETQ